MSLLIIDETGEETLVLLLSYQINKLMEYKFLSVSIGYHEARRV